MKAATSAVSAKSTLSSGTICDARRDAATSNIGIARAKSREDSRAEHLMFRLNDRAVLFLPPDTVEPGALRQIENTASLPFIYMHVAVMPDCHYGKGATVGTVIATRGAIIPAAVGVDIGCGMVAVRTPLARARLTDPA